MKYLREIRKLTGLSQDEFVDLVGIGRAWLTQLESNKGKQPSDDLKNAIQEAVLLRLLPTTRYMLSAFRREEESRVVANELLAYGDEHGTNALAKRRVLVLIINDPTYTKPTIVNGDLALRFHRSKSLKLDLIPLDDYDLNGLIKAFEAQEKYAIGDGQ